MACPACGTEVRAAPAPWAVRLAARLVAWTLAALALRALFAGGWLLRGAGAAFLFAFGRSAGSVAESLVAVIGSVGVFALMAEMAVGDRVPVLRPYAHALGKLLGLALKASLWLARATFLLVEGRPLPPLAAKAEKRPERKG